MIFSREAVCWEVKYARFYFSVLESWHMWTLLEMVAFLTIENTITPANCKALQFTIIVMFQNDFHKRDNMVRGRICLILLLGLSCLLLLVLSGPAPYPKRRRRRGVEEGQREEKVSDDPLEGSSGDDLGAGGGLGEGEEGSGDGRGGKRKGVKESRGTYFFCELHICHHCHHCHHCHRRHRERIEGSLLLLWVAHICLQYSHHFTHQSCRSGPENVCQEKTSRHPSPPQRLISKINIMKSFLLTSLSTSSSSASSSLSSS